MSTTVIAETTKGHRVWLQGLQSKVDTNGGRYNVLYTPEAIVVHFTPAGKRKLTASKGGIVDLVGKKVTLWAQGSDSATVVYNDNTITIKRS